MYFLVPNIPLWILLIPVKVRRRIPDASHLEFDCSEREIRGWVMARQSIFLRYWEWILGLQLWNCLYALHTVLIPSSYGVTVYCDKLVTSKDTKILSRGTLVLSIKLMKSVVSLRYDFCCCAIGWSCLSAKFDSRRAFAVRNNWSSLVCGLLSWYTKLGFLAGCEFEEAIFSSWRAIRMVGESGSGCLA